MEEKINILSKNVEHIIIENEETKEIIAIIAEDEIKNIKPYQVRIKEKG